MTANSQAPQARVDEFVSLFRRIRESVSRVVVGHEELLEQVLISFFAGGHVLIEGVPGIGKTLIVRTLADVLNLSFNRIQFTIDLMPSDITGNRMIFEDGGQRRLSFVPGPLFAHLVLADEINRATPKTQSALLEAMAELQCTVAGTSHPLPSPFFVLATLNPIEMEGTYPLPEAQLDRFLFKVVLSYPPQAEMERIITTTTGADLPQAAPLLSAATAAETLLAARRLVHEVLVAPPLARYAATLVRATVPRSSKFAPAEEGALAADEHIERYVSFGASPRGGQALLLGAKVKALLDGRVSVSFDDIDAVAVPALSHRLVLNYSGLSEQIDARALIRRLVERLRATADSRRLLNA